MKKATPKYAPKPTILYEPLPEIACLSLDMLIELAHAAVELAYMEVPSRKAIVSLVKNYDVLSTTDLRLKAENVRKFAMYSRNNRRDRTEHEEWEAWVASNKSGDTFIDHDGKEKAWPIIRGKPEGDAMTEAQAEGRELEGIDHAIMNSFMERLHNDDGTAEKRKVGK